MFRLSSWEMHYVIAVFEFTFWLLLLLLILLLLLLLLKNIYLSINKKKVLIWVLGRGRG